MDKHNINNLWKLLACVVGGLLLTAWAISAATPLTPEELATKQQRTAQWDCQ
jgi:hypothetical protein